MSIINQMLRDLDARQASAGERAGLPERLRTLPPEAPARRRGWLLAGGGLLVCALLAWHFLTPAVPPAPTLDQPAAVPPALAVSVAAAPSAEPVTAVTPSQPQPQPQPAAAASPVPPAKPVPVIEPATKPRPITAPAKVPAPVAKSAAVSTTSPAAPAPAAPTAAKPAEPIAAPAAEPPAVAHIDKQPKPDLASELAEAEYRKAMQAAASGDSVGAIPLLRRALELDPRHGKARQALMAVLAGGRHWEDVRRIAEGGLALDPTRTGWAGIVARVQHEQGDSAGALDTLDHYAGHAGGDADYQGLFAFLLQKQQRYAEAAQHYRAALALRPREGRWWFGLGLALEGAGQTEEAKVAFARARDSGNLTPDLRSVVDQKLK